MTFNFSVPTQEKSLELSIEVGDILFILGANGTGKSSLMQAFACYSSGRTRRIAAHRQTWFRSSSPEFTGQQRADYENNLSHYDRQASARWMDDYSAQRAQMAIYDLINSENVRARKITQAVDSNNTDEVKRLSAREGAFSILNRLLRLSNLDIVISIEKNDEIVAKKRRQRCLQHCKAF